jgi:hypothetical protein
MIDFQEIRTFDGRDLSGAEIKSRRALTVFIDHAKITFDDRNDAKRLELICLDSEGDTLRWNCQTSLAYSLTDHLGLKIKNMPLGNVNGLKGRFFQAHLTGLDEERRGMFVFDVAISKQTAKSIAKDEAYLRDVLDGAHRMHLEKITERLGPQELQPLIAESDMSQFVDDI